MFLIRHLLLYLYAQLGLSLKLVMGSWIRVLSCKNLVMSISVASHKRRPGVVNSWHSSTRPICNYSITCTCLLALVLHGTATAYILSRKCIPSRKRISIYTPSSTSHVPLHPPTSTTTITGTRRRCLSSRMGQAVEVCCSAYIQLP